MPAGSPRSCADCSAGQFSNYGKLKCAESCSTGNKEAKTSLKSLFRDIEASMAQYNLANEYYSGNGVKQDYKRAVELFTLVAEQGDAKSQYNLALMYVVSRYWPVMLSFVLLRRLKINHDPFNVVFVNLNTNMDLFQTSNVLHVKNLHGLLSLIVKKDII